jgi:hypothetical protein
VTLSSQPGSVVIDNARSPLADRFVVLCELFDSGSIRRPGLLDVSRGWHCLEVGGGGGSIAAWLSERDGPGGRVVVDSVEAGMSVPARLATPGRLFRWRIHVPYGACDLPGAVGLPPQDAQNVT